MGKRRGEKIEVVQINQQSLINKNWQDNYDATTHFAPSRGPSKLHRKKNQLQALVVDSVEREQEFAAKKDQTRRTKSEVRAKYGW